MSSSSYVERAATLIVDANILIGVVLGGVTSATRTIFLRLMESGVTLLAPEELLSELDEHLPRLLPRRLPERLPAHQQLEALRAANELWRNAVDSLRIVPSAEYRLFEATARQRIPRDPDDWPYVALALRMDCGIWTKNLAHFAESGIPIWSLETVELMLEE
jgi:predicted nucleic acid-binding protein